MSRPRIAVIGLGWVGAHRHIPSLRRSRDFKLVGLVDRHPDRAKRMARKIGLPFFAQAESLADVPWIGEVDAITLATPPTTHHELTLEGLRAGKHVLTEKPFAMTSAQAAEMVHCAKEHNRQLCVVHNFQFGRAMRLLRRALAKGKLGQIRRISATQLGNPERRLPTWYETLPAGLFFDESPHFFYLLRDVAGCDLSLREASAIPPHAGSNTPRLIRLLYESTSGFPVTVDCQFDSPVSEWHLMVSGTKGLGLVDIFRDIYLFLPNDKSHGTKHVLTTSFLAMGQHMLRHIPNGIAFMRGRLDYGNDEIMRRFARAIRTGQEDTAIGSSAAQAILRLQIEAIHAFSKASSL